MSHGTCQRCNGPLEMYFSPWCPSCDKPKLEPFEALNLIKALRYLEVNNPGIKDRLMGAFGDAGYTRNDTYTHIPLGEDFFGDGTEGDLAVLREAFGLTKDGAIFEISW